MMVMQGALTKLVEKGGWSKPIARRLARIRTSAEIADADLLIEAATENVDLKLDIFRRVDAVASEGAILASNTCSIPITRLAAATGGRTAWSACTS